MVNGSAGEMLRSLEHLAAGQRLFVVGLHTSDESVQPPSVIA